MQLAHRREYCQQCARRWTRGHTPVVLEKIRMRVLTTWGRVGEKLNVPQLVKNVYEVYGTWRFVTIMKRFRHLALSWAKLILSSSVPLYFFKTNFYIIPSALQFRSGLFPLRFPIKPLCVFVFAPGRCKPHSSSIMLASHCHHICLVKNGIGHYTVRVFSTDSNVHNKFHGTFKHSGYYVHYHGAS